MLKLIIPDKSHQSQWEEIMSEWDNSDKRPRIFFQESYDIFLEKALQLSQGDNKVLDNDLIYPFMTIEQLLISYELELLTPEVRHDVGRLDELLADDFFECGKDGIMFGKQECLAWLPLELSKSLQAYNLRAYELSADIWQIRYQLQISGDDEERTTSFRTSLWRRTIGGWQMFFHQGTLLKS